MAIDVILFSLVWNILEDSSSDPANGDCPENKALNSWVWITLLCLYAHCCTIAELWITWNILVKIAGNIFFFFFFKATVQLKVFISLGTKTSIHSYFYWSRERLGSILICLYAYVALLYGIVYTFEVSRVKVICNHFIFVGFPFLPWACVHTGHLVFGHWVC